MKHWRAPNKRKAYQPAREMQPHLGDIPDGLEPIRLPYRTHNDGPRWIENGTGFIVGLVAYAVFGAMLLLAIVLALLFAAPLSLANETARERQIRRDCHVDALKHCKTAIVSLDRGTIIACMIANKDKLSAACARHLWVNP